MTEKPTVPDVVPLVNAYYHLPKCGVGGGLHIVLADGNLGDDSIRYCIESAAAHWCEEVEATQLLGRVLFSLSKTQRKQVYHAHGGDSGVAPFGREELIARCRAILARSAPTASQEER